MKKGYLQVYTGNGKGKTTAAIGLAIRAAGAGLKVYFGQFIKQMEYSEVNILKNIEGITWELYGTNGCIFNRPVNEQDMQGVESGMKRAGEVIISGEFDVVILDEIFIPLSLGMIVENDINELVSLKPASLELVLIGRYAPEYIIETADLVTEMKEVKHYYEQGVKSRKGIEV